MQNKMIKKSYPFPLYDFSDLEEWLSDMAHKGFIFKKATLTYVFFEKTCPQNMAYHIEEATDGALCPAKEVLECRRKEGWIYIDTVKEKIVNRGGYFHIYISKKEPLGNGRHSHQGTNNISERIFQKTLFNNVFGAVSPLFVIGTAIYTSEEPLLPFVVKNDIAFLALFMSVISLSILLLCALRFFSFKRAKTPSQVRHYLGLRRFIKILVYVFSILTIAAILNFLSSLYYNRKIGNNFFINRSLLCPIQLQIDLTSDIGKSNNEIKGNHDLNFSNIVIEYYDLALESLADSFVTSLLEHGSESSETDKKYIDGKKILHWNISQDNDRKIAVQDRNTIIYTEYNSSETPAENAEKIMAYLKYLEIISD